MEIKWLSSVQYIITYNKFAEPYNSNQDAEFEFLVNVLWNRRVKHVQDDGKEEGDDNERCFHLGWCCMPLY